MRNWFKTKKEIVEPKPRKSLTPFSTDYITSKTRSLPDVLAVTFQKGIEHLYMKKGSQSVGMDSVCSDNSNFNNLTVAKMRNNRIIGLPDQQIDWYAGQGFIGWQTCAMLSQNWLIDKACTMPAKDAVRNGYEITVNDGNEVDPEILEYIAKQDKKFKLNKNCIEFIRMGRIFGIRVAMFKVDSQDKDYYEKPFNIDGVKPGSYKGISQIDPYWISPLLSDKGATDPSSINFYEPEWWLINAQRVHRSHLVIFRTCDLPDILKPTYIYGGIPVPQRIAERVYASERVANEAPMLAQSKRLTTYKVDISQAMANGLDFAGKMQIFTENMNNYGVKVLGDTEEIQQFDTSLADLDAVIMTQYQLVAAASEVPATKLLGTAPKGFNSTGEYDELSYHEFLESFQENDLTELVARHHELLIRSVVIPRFGGKPFSVDINWKPVNCPTAAELGEINFKKAQTDSTLAGAGAIDGLDIRARLISDKDSGYNGMSVEDDLSGEEEVAEDGYKSGEISGSSNTKVKNTEVTN